MWHGRRTIRGKLMLSISLPLLVTYLGLLAWDYYRQRNLTVMQMQQTVLERAEGTAARLETRLTSVEHATESLATVLENPGSRNDRQVQSGLASAARMPWVISATLNAEPTDSSPIRSITRRRGSGPPTQNRTESTPPAWHARAMASRGPGWTEPYELNTGPGNTTRRVCTYFLPIISENKMLGSAGITVDLHELRRLRGGRADLGPPGLIGPPRDGETSPTTSPARERPARLFNESTTSPMVSNPVRPDVEHLDDQELDDFAVLDAQGRVVIAASAAETQPPTTQTLFDTFARLGHPEMSEAARHAMNGQSQVLRIAGLKQVIPTVADDTHHWLAMTPIPATGWLLVTAVPESKNLAPVLDRLWGRAAFLAGGLIVLLIVVFIVSVSISRPIERLALAVDRVAAGDLGAELQNVPSKDELGRLTAGFNNMTRQLRSQMSALTEQTAAREKVESELRIARQIQTDLLPMSFPDSTEFALHALNLPAAHVAGDFYDFFFTPNGLLMLVIADVSGKGVPAALLMAVTRTVVRNLAQAGHSPVEIAKATNRTLVADSSASMFVTMLLCQYDPATGRLVYVNAGHPPGLRLRSGSDPAEACGPNSPLLGVEAEDVMGPFTQAEEQLAPGDTLFLYTDGVSEAPAGNGKLIGTAGVARFLRPLASESPVAICRQTSDGLEKLYGGHASDDITMLAIKLLGRAN